MSRFLHQRRSVGAPRESRHGPKEVPIIGRCLFICLSRKIRVCCDPLWNTSRVCWGSLWGAKNHHLILWQNVICRHRQDNVIPRAPHHGVKFAVSCVFPKLELVVEDFLLAPLLHLLLLIGLCHTRVDVLYIGLLRFLLLCVRFEVNFWIQGISPDI